MEDFKEEKVVFTTFMFDNLSAMELQEIDFEEDERD